MTAARRDFAPESDDAAILIAGMPFVPDPSGALYHHDERTLLVADLHLEKGSSFARRGMLLPPYDTRVTLAALAAVLKRYRPRRVVALGDNFHDGQGSARLQPDDRAALIDLQRGRDWVWLTGNHDPDRDTAVPGTVLPDLTIGAVTLRHEPSLEPLAGGEIAGHLHPAARVLATGGTARRRCFVSDGQRCIMPAFGAYAGGLNILHAAFRLLWSPPPRLVHVLGRDRVYPIDTRRCVPD